MPSTTTMGAPPKSDGDAATAELARLQRPGRELDDLGIGAAHLSDELP